MCVGCIESDARALRTVLSLTGVKEGLKGHIVVELSDLVKLVGGDLVETVVSHDVIGRLMIQCARQPGLAPIWEEILGFENCEFYIKRWPQLHGMQFEDILISFPDAIPCGIKVASCGGKIILNPEDSYVLQEDDEILVIAEDDDSYAPAALPMVLSFSFRNKDFL
ncbi:ION CHANNEL POLLUX-RELATED [Salix koriyanagi]|uniref:ION CHANNEL POLLUX-RELATED n=1 Tax=Salix koriyanagi TaxID=2511006 RepID=A0A9Q0WA66_9ROSI|nr:ION CHANNEL POLLUX-RELATED [Salix koriyanagi]